MKNLKKEIDLKEKEAFEVRRKAYAKGLIKAATERCKIASKRLTIAEEEDNTAKEALDKLLATPIEEVEVPEPCRLVVSTPSFTEDWSWMRPDRTIL